MKTTVDRRGFVRTLSLTGAALAFGDLTYAFSRDEADKLPSLLVDPQGHPITTLSGWMKQREVIKKRWLDYLGALAPNPEPPELTILQEDRPEGVSRRYVEYEGEPGEKVRGYLLMPEKIDKPLPGVVALHSTSDNQMEYIAGIKKGDKAAFGYNLARQGYVVFCPQCFLWHDNEGRSWAQQSEHFQQSHPRSKGMAKMLFDAQRAVDVLTSLEEVDASRLGAVGHSLGAKEAFYLAAFDERIGVTVSSEGGIGINFSNWDDVWYLGKEIHEFGHCHHEVLSLVAPRPFLLMGGDKYDGEKSRPYIEAVRPVYELYGKGMARNLALYNHRKGHSVPPEAEKKAYEWIRKYIGEQAG
jgi:predicted esterase